MIELVYDPLHNTIIFKKEGIDKTYTYDIDPNQKPIHASVNMTGIGDCVEIITWCLLFISLFKICSQKYQLNKQTLTNREQNIYNNYLMRNILMPS